MRTDPLDNLIRRWASFGAGFDASFGGARLEASPDDIDLDRLLLDTARLASSDAWLFIMAATWLQRRR